MLSTKNLMFKERPAIKLVDWYVSLYIINEVVFTNAIKLWLLTSMRIHLVVNISQVVKYREQVENQKVEEVKLVEMDGIEEWKMEKILNKRKIREVVKYLVWWKIFTTESNIWKKEKNLKNVKETVVEFERRISTEVRKQKKLDLVEE